MSKNIMKKTAKFDRCIREMYALLDDLKGKPLLTRNELEDVPRVPKNPIFIRFCLKNRAYKMSEFLIF